MSSLHLFSSKGRTISLTQSKSPCSQARCKAVRPFRSGMSGVAPASNSRRSAAGCRVIAARWRGVYNIKTEFRLLEYFYTNSRKTLATQAPTNSFAYVTVSGFAIEALRISLSIVNNLLNTTHSLSLRCFLPVLGSCICPGIVCTAQHW